MKIIRKQPSETTAPAIAGHEDPFSRMLTAFGPWRGFFDDFRVNNPQAGTALPATDVIEESDAFVARLDIPGVSKDDIEVTLDGSLLSVKAHRVTKNKDSESTLDYLRSFSLPEHVKGESVSASLDRGVLTLRLPKHEASHPRKISIAA